MNSDDGWRGETSPDGSGVVQLQLAGCSFEASKNAGEESNAGGGAQPGGIVHSARTSPPHPGHVVVRIDRGGEHPIC